MVLTIEYFGIIIILVKEMVLFKDEKWEMINGVNKCVWKGEKEGYFLGFGIDTYDENYPISTAIIEDKEGYVRSVWLTNFRFIDNK